jgi:nitrite reductase (NO-forming)
MARALPVIDGPDGPVAVGADPSSDRRVVRRDLDRRIAVGGIGVALGFIAAAPVSIALGGATWTTLHLLLAGAAGTAIAATMPFFAAALSVAPPAPPWLRIATLGLLAPGAVMIAVAVPGAGRTAALLGAGIYLLGLVGLFAATLLPVRRGLGARHGAIVDGYLVAVAFVIVGVGLVLALLHDVAPVVRAWALLKPAHAWLNLIGFVGLVLAATFLHLIPTVLAARIAAGPLPRMAIGGLAIGVALTAGGFALGSDVAVRGGALVTLVGAATVPAYVRATAGQHGRGRWTTELAWHRFVTGTLVASAGWFAIGVGAAALLAVVHGAAAEGWSLAVVGVPLVVGSVLQAIVGSTVHVLPTGGSSTWSRTRGRLGRAASLRLVGYQIATAILWAALLASGPAALRLDALRLLAGGAIVVLVAAALAPLLGAVARGDATRGPSRPLDGGRTDLDRASATGQG